jgi:hypothetical protein
MKFFLSGTANSGRSGQGVCPPLEKAFQSLGVELGSVEEADFIVNLNHNRDAFINFKANERTARKAFLIALEPFSVYPSQYSLKSLTRYEKTYFPGNVLRQDVSDDFLAWPYTFNKNPSHPEVLEQDLEAYLINQFTSGVFSVENWKQRKRTLVMIAGNKVSPTSENLYGLRRLLARSFDDNYFQLFGPLWSDGPLKRIHHRAGVANFAFRSGYWPRIKPIYGDLHHRYRCSVGLVADKHSVLKDSKYSLVVENSLENITEKLFDSLINGSIPIYIGPSLRKAGIPPGVAIEGITDALSMQSRIKRLTESEISNYLTEISNFLSSDNFRNVWNSDSVYKKIAGDIVSMTSSCS